MSIRKAKAEDLEFVKAIEIECGLSPWSAADYLNEISRKDSIFFVAATETESEIIGYVLARLITIQNLDDEESLSNFVELYNIGVKNNFRKKGLGTIFLEKLISFSKSVNAEHIILEVRTSNHSAVALYNKLGFEQIYERKNLYQNPSENGFGMKLHI